MHIFMTQHAKRRLMRRKGDKDMALHDAIIRALKDDAVDWPRSKTVKIDLMVGGKNFHCILEPIRDAKSGYVVKTII